MIKIRCSCGKDLEELAYIQHRGKGFDIKILPHTCHPAPAVQVMRAVGIANMGEIGSVPFVAFKIDPAPQGDENVARKTTPLAVQPSAPGGPATLYVDGMPFAEFYTNAVTLARLIPEFLDNEDPRSALEQADEMRRLASLLAPKADGK